MLKYWTGGGLTAVDDPISFPGATSPHAHLSSCASFVFYCLSPYLVFCVRDTYDEFFCGIINKLLTNSKQNSIQNISREQLQQILHSAIQFHILTGQFSLSCFQLATYDYKFLESANYFE